MCVTNNNSLRSLILLLLLICAFTFGLANSESTPNPHNDVTILSSAEFYVGQSNLISVRSRQLVSKLTITTSHEGIRDFSFTIDPNPINPSSTGWYQYDVNYKIPYQSDENPVFHVRINFLLRLCEQAECSSVRLVNLTETKSIISSTVLLLGETDKPIYRPGELVRIRFLALDPNPVPTSEQPDYVLSRDDQGKALLKRSTNRPSLPSSSSIFGHKFDKITITNPNGDHVKQWLNPSALQAANLSFQLLPDAEQGSWSIQAKLGHQAEKLKIKVKKYVLPRFLISIEPTKQLFTDSKEAVVSVCAKYTNGQPMKGTAHVSFCICDTYDLTEDYDFDMNADDDRYAKRRVRTDSDREPKKLEDILETQTCPKNRFANVLRSCLAKSQPLTPEGCTKLNFSIDNYLQEEKRLGTYLGKPVICVKIEEDGTGSSVSKCEVGNRVQVRERSLKLEFPTVYRPGLPILGRVRLQGSQVDQLDPNGRMVKIVVEELNMRCDWYQESSKSKQHFYLTHVELDGQGLASVLIPPIVRIARVRIHARLVDHKPDKEDPSLGRNALPRRIPYPPINPPSDHIMEPWASLDGGAIQLWSEEFIMKPTCPGQLKLKLVANRPLANKMLFVESVVRRKHLSVSFPPELTMQHDKCRDRDDQLGHYKCLGSNSNEIECLDGWRGNDCLEPICSPTCSKQGGTCSRPGECLCQPGWNGTNCDQCVVRSGCKHGKCVLGDDCVCDSGWRGYYCAQKVVHFERVQDMALTENDDESETTGQENKASSISTSEKEQQQQQQKAAASKPNRTLFEREITLNLDSNWGPEANLILYFMDIIDDVTSVVTTSFRIEGMTRCTSHAIAIQQDSNSDGLSIQPKSVDPGSKIQLNIMPHVLTRNQSTQSELNEAKLSDASEFCFVRISDTALDNYDGDSKNLVDFVYYAGKLKRYGSTSSDSYRLPESNLDAFRLAGLQLSASFVQGVIRPTITPCLYAFMTRSGQPGPPTAPIGFRENVDALDSPTPKMIEKPRLRDFFPEVWLFDLYPIRELPAVINQEGSLVRRRGVQLDLTVPDSITTWRASTFCTTQNDGLFIAKPQTLLVSMPFFIDLTIPKEAKRGEILHLPLSIFVYDRPNNDKSNQSNCYEVSMTTELDPNDWLRIGADKYTGCVCTGEKQTFIMSLMPKRLGHLNVTAEAYAIPDSPICSSETAKDSTNMKPLADRIRRSIQVVPEGIAAETSVGDILCFGDSHSTTEQKFPLNLPSNIVPGSLRTYVSYSDEVLGPALVNLDNLVKLPTGCGEQNMVLVAPNVFVLDYLLSTAQSDPMKHKSLIQKAKGHIEKGYHQQLKYRRSDGSFSAWGESDTSGSTWLTAFVLRVFHKATKLGLTFSFDEKLLFDDTIRYLLNQQDPLTGCFIEKGRVLHEGMQGSVGEKGSHILLTTYVSAVLWPIIPKDENLARIRNESLGRVFKGCLKTTESVDWSNISTPILVQYAHNMVLMNSDSELSVKLVELVRGRSQTTEGGSMHKMYWARELDPNSRGRYGALDIETTAYAYLTLAKAGLPSSELLPIIRWLSSQQKAQGGFHSTQDTVLGLEVISDFAKRLGLSKKSENQHDFEVSFTIEPLGYSKTELFTLEQRGYLNRQQIPVNSPEQVALNLWNITSKNPSARECLAVQIALLYNLPDPIKADQSHFDITTSVVQSMTYPEDKSCTKASLLICIRPNLNRKNSNSDLESGMLLISVTMVTGWTPSDDLISSHMNSPSREAVKRIEIGDTGQVSVYFDGFSQTEADQAGGWTNVKRCVTVSMHQTVYIEDAKPGIITARDYYMNERMVETSYLLDECREAWQISARPVRPDDKVTTPNPINLSSTTPFPISECPICEMDAQTKTKLADNLYQIRCHSATNLIFVKPIDKDESQLNVTVSQFTWGSMIANWNATINRTTLSKCKCEPLDKLESMIVYSPARLNIYAGDPDVSFLQTANLPECIPFSPEDNSLYVLSARQILNLIEPLVSQWNQKNDTQCKHFESVIKYVKRKIVD